MSKTGSAIFSSGLTGIPAFTGDYELVGGYSSGYLLLKSSGILTLPFKIYSFFGIGGGAAGSFSSNQTGGRGGGSGYTFRVDYLLVSGAEATVTIGAGGIVSVPDAGPAHGTPGGSSILAISGLITYTAAGSGSQDGGCGGGQMASSSPQLIAGDGGSDGADGGGTYGGTGQGTTTRAPNKCGGGLYGGAGGGGAAAAPGQYGGAGGLPSGGRGGDAYPYIAPVAGLANTGAGGGGAPIPTRAAANGGSGLIIVGW